MTLDHIEPSFHAVMKRSDRDRILFLHEERWLGYEAANTALTAMKRLFDLPPADRMPGLLLVADGFNGKTKILKRFIELHGQGHINADYEPVKPVIMTQSQGPSEKRLYISILERFHAPYRANDSASKLYYQVITQCRACHVKMLFIDEIHDLLSGPRSGQAAILTTIKHLSNEINIPIVGAGTKEAVRALHMTDQLATRFDVVTLPLWQANVAFQQLLTGMERTLPLKHASHLSRPELATAIYDIAGGRLGDTRRFLKECAEQAIMSGNEYIDLDLVQGNKKWKRPTGGIRELIG